MTISPAFRMVLRISTFLALLVIYVPLMLVVLNSFNSSQTFAWPPKDLTFEWWHRAWESTGVREAILTSVQVALLATVLALVLGTMAAMALQRYGFFGRDAVSLLIILPIALPGIVTGIALNNAFRTNQGPVVNVVAVVLIVASVIPIWISQRLAGSTDGLAGR